MRRVLIVDSSDFERRFVSVDLTPNPMPLISDLNSSARQYAAVSDTVIFLDDGADPVVLKSPELNLGPYPWKKLEKTFSSQQAQPPHRTAGVAPDSGKVDQKA